LTLQQTVNARTGFLFGHGGGGGTGGQRGLLYGQNGANG